MCHCLLVPVISRPHQVACDTKLKSFREGHMHLITSSLLLLRVHVSFRWTIVHMSHTHSRWKGNMVWVCHIHYFPSIFSTICVILPIYHWYSVITRKIPKWTNTKSGVFDGGHALYFTAFSIGWKTSFKLLTFTVGGERHLLVRGVLCLCRLSPVMSTIWHDDSIWY